MKREIKKALHCCKCRNKQASELYYQTTFSGTFSMSIDKVGNEDIDWGGYSLLEDFLDNMLVETGKRKLIGCSECIK